MIIISAQAFPPRTGGIQYLLAGTATSIAEAGFEVLVLADGGADAHKWSKATHLPYRIEWFGGPRPIRRWMKARRARHLLKQGGVEALYADSWKSLELLPASMPCRVVTWAHGNEFPTTGQKIRRIRDALAKADHILFNSRETQERARNFLPQDSASCIVNPPIFEATPAQEADRQWMEAAWNGASPRLISMCRLIDWKGIDQSISALPAILARYPAARLAIAGEGPDMDRLKGLVRSLGLDEHVVFLGWIEGSRKTALLQSGDLFLQPGRQVIEEREGYGITYVEAALQGLPTICGNAGGAPEAIIDGTTGLVVDASRSEPVAEAVLSLLDCPDRLEAMRVASRNHATDCLWQHRIKDILAPCGLTPLTSPEDVGMMTTG